MYWSMEVNGDYLELLKNGPKLVLQCKKLYYGKCIVPLSIHRNERCIIGDIKNMKCYFNSVNLNILI